MRRTASSIRVALRQVYLQDRPTRLAMYRIARRHNAAMGNTLSVEVPLEAAPSDWRTFDDPYGRDFDDAVDDLRDVGRTLGMGDLKEVVKGRKHITFFIEYDEGIDEEKAMYDLEKYLSKKLRDMARDDEGIAALVFGMGKPARNLGLDPESETWSE